MNKQNPHWRAIINDALTIIIGNNPHSGDEDEEHHNRTAENLKELLSGDIYLWPEQDGETDPEYYLNGLEDQFFVEEMEWEDLMCLQEAVIDFMKVIHGYLLKRVGEVSADRDRLHFVIESTKKSLLNIK